MRIAMWSGPRNLSTALMYSFGNRADTVVVDEPFYGAFLTKTGIDHPLAAEVMAAMECDPGRVVAGLRSYAAPHQYEKHMVHHMVAGMPLDWVEDADLRHVILLRHPTWVLASYLRKREAPTAADLGFTQLEAIYQRVREPLVVDSSDIRANPRGVLAALCDALGLPFDEAMLRWEAGPKPFDGAWAAHWYDAVHRSTGFEGAEGLLPSVPPDYRAMVGEAEAVYGRLAARKLTVD